MLTNCSEWHVYHVTAAVPVTVELAFSVNSLGEESIAQKAEHLFYLTRESLKRRQIDEVWKARRATSPDSLGRILRSEVVVAAIRKELRRETGHRIEATELLGLMEDTVLRPECLDP